MNIIEHLSRLEAAYGIEREAPQRLLEQAREDQQCLEELAEKHSCELSAWSELAGALDDRRTRVLDAAERLIAETLELDDAVFGAFSKTDCVDVLRTLKGELARALERRVECARTLIAFAGAYREEGYAGSELIDKALTRAIAQVRDRSGVPDATAAEYIKLLAQLCGVGASSGAANQDNRFPDLSARFNHESGRTLEDLANRTQQTALGLWPEE